MKDGKFETQAEIWQYLLDGKKIQYDDGDIVFLENGKAMTLRCGKLDNNCSWSFLYPQEWSIYEEPKPKKKITLYTHIVKYVLQEDVYETLRPTTRNAEDIEKNMVGVKVVSTTCKEVEVDDV